MKKQSDRFPKNYLLCLLTAALSLAAFAAWAQAEDAAETESVGEASTDAASPKKGPERAAAPETKTEPGALSEAEAEAETEKASSESASAEDAAEEETSASTDEKEPLAQSKEKQKFADEAAAFFDSIGIRRLEGKAYPTYKTRGLVGGSLWRTFHGLQWPYMQRSGIGISGSLWIDTGYEKIDRTEDPNQPDTKYILQEGRLVLRVTPTYSRNRWFIQGQSEFVANKDQNANQPQVADVDDLWVRVGMWNLFDIQAGRFEAWELYHFGMGMDLNTLERRGAFEATSGLAVPDVYGVTDTYYRPSGLGNVAAHFYPTKFFRFELLGQLGNEGGLNTGAFRGAGILDFGWVKIKGGGEYKKQFSQNDGPEKRDERGFGGAVQFVLKQYVEFGASGGWAITDHMDSRGNIDEQGSYNIWSAGGFLNARIIKDLLIGGGAHFTNKWDIHEDQDHNVGEFSHLQAFGALQYLLFDRLYIKAVVAFARAHFAPSFTENDPYYTKMISGRLRLQYDF